MKKLFALMIALTCLVSLVACGGNPAGGPSGQDSALTDFATAVANSEPSTVECEIEVTTSAGDSIGATITYMDDDIDDINVEYFNTLTPGTTPASKPTKSEQFKKFSDKNPVELSQLTFNAEYFKGGNYSIENGKFTAVVVDCEGFFGVDIISATNVNVEITLDNGVVDEIVISYSVSGPTVEIVMTCR